MFDIQLLACTWITDAARKELTRAGCPVHKDVLWEPLQDVEIVELQHAGDMQMMSVWGTPREIQIPSRGLYLNYRWEDKYQGMALFVLDEKTSEDTEMPEPLGDLDDHPF